MVEKVMAWLEAHIITTAQHVDDIGESLTQLGAQALTNHDAGNQPIYEPALNTIPIWSDTRLVGLFDAELDMKPVSDYLHRQQAAGCLQNFHFKPLADENWERRCLIDFKPFPAGQRLWVCPTWETPPAPGAINIILDPGLAFGTGTHATTALCLAWLDEKLKTGSSVIDYGCGSGILAIAALKLGAQHALAIDHDPQALIETQRNGERNQLSTQQLETALPEKIVTEPVDLVIANILAQPLILLAPYLASLVKPQGQILLSGILIEQAEAVALAYSPWFKMDAPVAKDEWIRLEGRTRNTG